MYRYPQYHNYDLDPRVKIHGYDGAVAVGNEALAAELRRQLKGGARTICFETYPGVDVPAICSYLLKQLPELRVIHSDDARLSQQCLREKYGAHITDDRVFGVMCCGQLQDCFDAGALRRLRDQALQGDGPCVVIGVGASLALPEADHLWYWDITRWEIQLRYRRGMGTWLAGEMDGQQLTKYKVGFFLEWRFADRHKRQIMEKVSNWVDANVPAQPRMIGAEAYRAAIRQTAAKPFRMQAYYDPSVWGGQWMKNVFGLDPEVKNYGWSFDGVPEENSIKFAFGDEWAMFPAMDLVLAQPQQLMGEHVYGRFGAEFPIRFDFLDTMEGGNLSLQVHPLTGYIQEKFGMHYTQDESYYILDVTDESCVYIGLREGVQPDAMRAALEEAQAGGEPFDAERFVNRFPVKKHDHVLIPAGTVHCSGRDTVVLEISATPYIFTFKLWDWGRIGLDGRPRPIHIDHGMANIQFDRDTGWVRQNLLHQERIVAQDACGIVEHTGLHNLEFIETQRHTILGSRIVSCDDSVVVVNLVEGREAQILSTDDAFEPMSIHYAETFIVPASVGSFVVSSGEKVMLMTAKVRG